MPRPSLPRWALIFALAPAAACGGADEQDVDRVASAITNGTADAHDSGIVALMSHGLPFCSGTLIGPRVVLTAAHCLNATTPEQVFFGISPQTSLDGGTSVAVLAVRSHPDYDPVTLAHDMAAMLLASDPPPGVALAALLDTGLDATPGVPVRLVGFGGGEKREGQARILSIDPGSFRFGPDPSQICQGDSGGPVFVTAGAIERLAGVASFTASDCLQSGTATRVDAELAAFVQPFLAATAMGEGPVGTRCYDDSRCAGGSCVFPEDAPAYGYCSATCASPADCTAPMTCVDRTCQYPLPSPGALGGSCTREDGCATGVCARSQLTQPFRCTEQCFADDPSPCTARERCAADPDRPGVLACFGAATRATASCSLGTERGSDQGEATLAAVAAVALACTRRRAAKKRG